MKLFPFMSRLSFAIQLEKIDGVLSGSLLMLGVGAFVYGNEANVINT